MSFKEVFTEPNPAVKLRGLTSLHPTTGGPRESPGHATAMPPKSHAHPLRAHLHQEVEDSQRQDDHSEEWRAGHDDHEGGDGVVEGIQQHEDGGSQNLIDDVDVLGEAVEDAA